MRRRCALRPGLCDVLGHKLGGSAFPVHGLLQLLPCDMVAKVSDADCEVTTDPKQRHCDRQLLKADAVPGQVKDHAKLVQKLIGGKQGNFCRHDANSENQVGASEAHGQVVAPGRFKRVSASELERVCARNLVRAEAVLLELAVVAPFPVDSATGALASRVQNHDTRKICTHLGLGLHLENNTGLKKGAILGDVGGLVSARVPHEEGLVGRLSALLLWWALSR